MMCYARLSTESKDAAAVSKSLKPDNVGMECLKVTTSTSGAMIVSEVDAGSVITLMSTLDDLIMCQMTSEALLEDG
jgi:hypothetical protein